MAADLSSLFVHDCKKLLSRKDVFITEEFLQIDLQLKVFSSTCEITTIQNKFI